MIWKWEDLLGKPVIVRSNEAEATMTGEFKGFDTISGLPIVELGGQNKIVGGIIIPFNQDVMNFLVKYGLTKGGELTGKPQQVMGVRCISTEAAGGKATYEMLAEMLMGFELIRNHNAKLAPINDSTPSVVYQGIRQATDK